MSRGHEPGEASAPFWRSRHGIGLFVIAAVAGYFLFAEHAAHVAGYLPWLLLAACPLMHFFMHRPHGHRGHGRSSATHERDTGDESR